MVLNRRFFLASTRMLATVATFAAIATVAANDLGAQGRGRGSFPDSARLDSMRRRLVSAGLVQYYVTRRGRPEMLLYGVALECTKCTKPTPGARLWDSVFTWYPRDSARGQAFAWLFYIYTEWPRVAAVAPGGPAERAGVLVGDSLVAVNGQSILAPSGSREFNNARAGDNVTLTLRRGGRDVDVSLALNGVNWVTGRGRQGGAGGGEGAGAGGGARGRGMGGGARGGLPLVGSTLPLRFEGRVGAAPVEVMSDSPLTVEMEASGDLVIHVAGSTVRVHPTGPGRGGGRAGRGALREP
jgi:membrane-associated protease RseP (regulator of RpoE activity)